MNDFHIDFLTSKVCVEIMSLNSSPGERQDAAEKAGLVFLLTYEKLLLVSLGERPLGFVSSPSLWRGKVNVTRAWPDPRENRAVLVTAWVFGVSKHLDVPSSFVSEES